MIYIVTSGEYSDYSIDAVFQDKNKAEAYCKCHPNAEIEEWEFFDDNIYTPYNVVRIDMDILSKDDNRISFRFETLSKEDDDYYMVNKDAVTVYNTCHIKITLIRMLPQNYDKESIKNKYTKVFYDLIPEIKYIISDMEFCDDLLGQGYEQRTYASRLVKDFIAGKFGIETESV